MHSHYALVAATFAVSILGFAPAAAGHGSGVVVQRLQDELIIGTDDGVSQLMGQRAFTAVLTSNLVVDAPSFVSLSNAPAGYETLPSEAFVYWDFLPMTVGNQTSNLLHWDVAGAAPTDVRFEHPDASGTQLTLYGRNFEPAAVYGDAAMVPGKTIDETLATGNLLRLHAHRFFELASSQSGQLPAPGIYLTALRLRMEGLLASEPFFVALATPDVSTTALAAAQEWMLARQDALVVRGDYQFDGKVDGSDLLVWQRQFGYTGTLPLEGAAADGSRNSTIDTADWEVWQAEFARPTTPIASPLAATIPIPEPTAILHACGLIAAWALHRRPRA